MEYSTDLSGLAPESLHESNFGQGTYARVDSTWERVIFDSREFDALDTKGRRFGAWAAVDIETRKPVTEARRLSQWIGRKYCFRGQSMRDGESYGSGGRPQYFGTMKAAEAAMVKYFAGAEKRALSHKARKI